MSDPESSNNRRIPTLVQLCQRVAAANVDSITTLGDDLSYPLVKPILERCSMEQLLRIEGSSPHLQVDTPEIWMQLCIRKFPMGAEKFLNDEGLEPTSWRDRYMVLKEEEERRLEEVGSKLRSQRLEAEERKKEREVKITDRVPLPKRSKTGWGAPVQPKTLLQKTLSEASKIQRSVYSVRMLPPMVNGKSPRVLPQPSCPIMPTPPTSNHNNRVTVNSVAVRRPVTSSAQTTSLKCQPQLRSTTVPSSSADHPNPSSSLKSHLNQVHQTSSTPEDSECVISVRKPPLSNSPSSKTSGDTRPLKAAVPMKKDPMAALFVPKHRAYSQRPV